LKDAKQDCSGNPPSPTGQQICIKDNSAKHLLADDKFKHSFTITVGPDEAPITNAN
jgi:hypothetical protein